MSDALLVSGALNAEQTPDDSGEPIFDKYSAVLNDFDPILFAGRVEKVRGQLVQSLGPQAVVGEVCRIHLGGRVVHAEVVGLTGPHVQLMCFEDMTGIEVGSRVIATGGPLLVPVGNCLLGRVVDAFGRPLDGRGEIGASAFYPVSAAAPGAMNRERITSQIETGVRAIDGLLAVGKGQRMGIFAGSGVGKSTLMGMIARNTKADVNVIALIGERGREVREFIEYDLGSEGLARSVIVVSTSDTPDLAKLKGALSASAMAEYFRDQGRDVMFLFDSVTRYAWAQREVGLSIGEPPTREGYPPSVFSGLQKLLERSGASDKGTITAFYTVLVEGDDMKEPVTDTVRGTLDGHLVLSRKIAQRAQYPAVDILESISRLMDKGIAPQDVRAAASYLRRMLAVYTESEDLINLGAYVQGTNAEIDEAIRIMPALREFLNQAVEEKAGLEETRAAILKLAVRAGKAAGGEDEDEQI
ncbi:MAG: FliI/YscN family ATPase [Spirochaetales bacterium]|jgi:flagellum-specific ATP synthase|nr:FliI/YscN family ATPase [Spirochaetales bacterium]